MTRGNSSYNWKKLLLNNCRRQIPLFSLSLLALIIFAPIQTVLFLQSNRRMWAVEENLQYIYSVVRSELNEGWFATATLIMLAVVAAMSVFHYLHSRNQTDFYHALPLRRGQLFALNTATGLLAVVPAYIIGVLLSCAVIAGYGYGGAILWKRLLLSMALHLAGFLLVYAVSILCAILCGNTLVALFGCAWLQGGIMVGVWCVELLLDIMYPTRVITATMHAWLSPVAYMADMCGTMGESYYGVGLNDEAQTSALTSSELLRCAVIPMLVVLVIAIAVLALSYALYRVRKSEKTGQSMAFAATELPFKMLMTIVIAIGSGLVFYGTTNDLFVLYIGMILGGVIISSVIEIIYDMDFHSLLHRWKSTVVFGIVCAVVVACMAFDVTGYNTRLPAREDIASANLVSYVDSWRGCTTNNGLDDLAKIASQERDGNTDLYETENLDTMYAIAQHGVDQVKQFGNRINSDDVYENGSGNYTVNFTLKNGKTFSRTYYADWNDEELIDKTADLRTTEEYREKFSSEANVSKYSKAVGALVPFTWQELETTATREINDSEQIATVLEALRKESAKLDKNYLAENAPVAMLRVVNTKSKASAEKRNTTAYRNWNNSDDGWYDGDTGSYLYGNGYIDMPIYASETETLQLLTKYCGFPAADTLVDPNEIVKMNQEQYDDNGEYAPVVYTQEEDAKAIAEACKYLLPQEVASYVDPIYQTDDVETVGITWKSGVTQSFNVSNKAENADFWKAASNTSEDTNASPNEEAVG